MQDGSGGGCGGGETKPGGRSLLSPAHVRCLRRPSRCLPPPRLSILTLPKSFARLPATPAVFPQASPFSLLGLWNVEPAPEGGEAEELVPRSHEIYRLSNLNKRRGNARKPSEMAR